MSGLFKRDEVVSILERARKIDAEVSRKHGFLDALRGKYTLFGADKHKYALDPPVDKSLVESVERRYGFSFPRDYVEFITETGDGGAGPDYGIEPFSRFAADESEHMKPYRESLAAPFAPRKMLLEDVEDFAITTREGYEKEPGRYFVCEKEAGDDDWYTDGLYTLGTHGCQWDFVLVTAGERRGQVFDTDNEGAFAFAAGSFEEFYGQWLERLSDTESFRRELIERWELIAKIR